MQAENNLFAFAVALVKSFYKTQGLYNRRIKKYSVKEKRLRICAVFHYQEIIWT